jgi:hypothetical protein
MLYLRNDVSRGKPNTAFGNVQMAARCLGYIRECVCRYLPVLALEQLSRLHYSVDTV